MTKKMAAVHRQDKVLTDAIFGASAAAQKATAEHGAENVTNATIGVIMDDNEKLACIPSIEKAFKELPMNDLIAYAPIAGLPDYLSAAIDLTVGDNRPEGYLAAIATAGGTGAVHHAIMNYSEIGEKVLTSDWFWGPYSVICNETGRSLTNYTLFDENQNFNIADFSRKVKELLQEQNSLLVIINTPAHNPTGYSLSENDWTDVLKVCKDEVQDGKKKISILVDIAYIDYAGEKNESRKFIKQFSNLPANIFIMFAFSMSKGYTMYGQRTGAIVGLSADEEVIAEFNNVVKYSSRAAWSNINRGAMALLSKVQKDEELLTTFEAERDALYEMIKERANVFMEEAKECGLNALPYKSGFFISIPTTKAQAICDKLHDDLIFLVALKLGIRVAVCGVPVEKIKGMATKIKKAMDEIGE